MTKYSKSIFIETTCYKCGMPIRRRLKKNKPQKYFVCVHCLRSHSNPKLAGGTKTPEGYILLAVDGDRLFAHRAIMEKHIGRKLKSTEIVHHLNGIRDDNRIENLVITDPHSHPRKSFIQQLQERIRELESQMGYRGEL